jgi:hypothetical protein
MDGSRAAAPAELASAMSSSSDVRGRGEPVGAGPSFDPYHFVGTVVAALSVLAALVLLFAVPVKASQVQCGRAGILGAFSVTVNTDDPALADQITTQCSNAGASRLVLGIGVLVVGLVVGLVISRANPHRRTDAYSAGGVGGVPRPRRIRAATFAWGLLGVVIIVVLLLGPMG